MAIAEAHVGRIRLANREGSRLSATLELPFDGLNEDG
jgi:hypothetical protein